MQVVDCKKQVASSKKQEGRQESKKTRLPKSKKKAQEQGGEEANKSPREHAMRQASTQVSK